MRETDVALLNTEAVLAVDEALIDRLERLARSSPTRRYRLCLHHSPDETVQEMIVVHCRDNYSRPHAHDTPSSCLLLRGRLTVVLFDEEGRESRRIDLEAGGAAPFALRLGPNVWHMPVCRSEQAVFYETLTGPFVRERVNRWAPWSPAEDDTEKIARYLRSLGFG